MSYSPCRILYVSESVDQVLNYSQGDLFGQSLFDILHPKDIAKVKEQISSSDLTPRERLIDSKTMLPVRGGAAPLVAAAASSGHLHASQHLGRLSPGARRSFFCRMKAKAPLLVKEESSPPGSNGSPSGGGGGPFSSSPQGGGGRKGKKGHLGDKKYVVVHCTGYLKSWALTKIGVSSAESDLGGMAGEGTSAGASGGAGGGGSGPSDPDGILGGGGAGGSGGGLVGPAADAANTCMSCLVAVGRTLPTSAEQSTAAIAAAAAAATTSSSSSPPNNASSSHRSSSPSSSPLVRGAEFSARLTVDGTFAYVDQRVTTVLGFLPQELTGSSVYEHLRWEDVPMVQEWHRAALREQRQVRAGPFRLRAKDGRFVSLRAQWKQFRWGTILIENISTQDSF